MKPASIWDWLGPFTLMATFIAYLYLSTPSQIVLCYGHDNCLRDWTSALSGWAAVLAAVVTVWKLSQQINDADRHHRENAMITLRRKRSICGRIIRLGDEYERFVKGSELNWSESAGGGFSRKTMTRDAAQTELSILQTLLREKAFDIFEDEIELIGVQPAIARARIDRAEVEANKLPDSFYLRDEMAFAYRMVDCYEFSEMLHGDAKRRASKYLADTESMILRAGFNTEDQLP